MKGFKRKIVMEWIHRMLQFFSVPVDILGSYLSEPMFLL